MEIIRELWQHQIAMHDEMLASLQAWGYGWLLAGCRTGKTATSIVLAKSLGAKRVLVITTAAAMTATWPQEIADVASGYELLTLNKGTSKTKAVALKAFIAAASDKVKFVVVNYETAVLIADDIKAAGFDFVVADECQKLRSHDSKQSTILAIACSGIPYRLAMTGTPWDDKLADVYGQVRWLDPLVKGKKTVHSRIFDTWGSFLYRFCNTFELSKGVVIINGYKNVSQLADKIRPFLYRIRTEDVLDLPETRTIVRTVPMRGELKRMYQGLEEEMIAQFGSDYLIGDNRLVCELRLHQLTGGFVTPMRIDDLGRYVPTASIPTAVPDDSGDAKLDALLELVDEFGGEPFVVFTRFTADVAKIKAALEKRKLKVLQLTGEVKENEAFEAGQGDCLIANIQAGNAGIRLTRARLVVDYTIGNSRTDFIQSRYRFLANGLDKSKPIVYHFLQMENSVDGEILKRMQSKEGDSDELFYKLGEQVASRMLAAS
jgi:hypothetical protein